MPVHLLFLGPFKHDARLAESFPSKAIALLGMVAVSPAPVPRERVLDLLWPASSPDAARKNLRNVLWSIRKGLGEEAIASEEDRLALGRQIHTDLHVFEQAVSALPTAGDDPAASVPGLEKATALYRGTFLQDLVVEESPDFEIWLDGERERLAQANLRMLAVLVGHYQAREEWNQVIATAERTLKIDDLQEPIVRALMQAHALLGQRAEALRAYDAVKNALARELGVEPLSETTELRASIVAGAYDQPANARRPMPVKRTRVGIPLTVESTPFVGREHARAQLDAEWTAARARTARVVILSGELGIGKSRLWREWSRSLNSDTAILEARCLESTQSLPLAPIAELLRTHSAWRPLFYANSPLSTVWLAELKRLVPDLVPRRSDMQNAGILPPEEERRRLFEALLRVFLALDRSQVLFIDDIQWADTTTLDWLDYAIHQMAHERFLLVVATRPEDSSSELVRLLARWGREGLARRIELERLSREEGAVLATALGMDVTRSAGVLEKSAGNPYFMIELIRALPTEVPPVLAELVKARLQRLSEAAQQVVQAGAILDPDLSMETLRRTSGRGEEETLDALDLLIGAGVLEERGNAFTFSHPLVGQVMREALGGARCVVLHRRAAQALEQTLALGRRAVTSRIAAHWEQAGERLQAAHYYDLAAEYALTVASPNQAAGFRCQALELDPTPHRHFKLGETLFRLGELAGARSEFETAQREFERKGDRTNAGHAALRIAETLFPSGQFEEGYRWIERGVSYIGEDSDPAIHTMVHLLRGSAEIESGHPDLAEEQLRAAAQHVDDHHLIGVGGRVYFLWGNALAEEGELAQALEAYRASLKFSEESGDEFQQALTLNNLSYHAILVGDIDAAHRDFDRGLALAEQRALRVPLQNLFSTRGEIALAEQEWQAAEEWFQRGLAEAERNHNAREQANYRANLGRVAEGKGDVDAALGAFESARQQAEALGDHHLKVKIDLLLAELYRRRGEHKAAREALDRARRTLAVSPRRLYDEWAARLGDQLAK